MRETLRKEQLMQRILLISMILLSILLGTIIVNASDTGQPVKYYTSIEVEHNDTLWSLEERYNNGTEDRDTYINNIKQLNNMRTDIITEGRYILLYYYWLDFLSLIW